MPVLCTICDSGLHKKPPDIPSDGENGDNVVISLKCGHVFHRPCVLQWFRRGSESEGEGQCPNCRATCKLVEAITIYLSLDPNIEDISDQVGKLKEFEEGNRRLKSEVNEMSKMINALENRLQLELKLQETIKQEHEDAMKELLLKTQTSHERQERTPSTETGMSLDKVITEKLDRNWEILQKIDQVLESKNFVKDDVFLSAHPTAQGETTSPMNQTNKSVELDCREGPRKGSLSQLDSHVVDKPKGSLLQDGLPVKLNGDNNDIAISKSQSRAPSCSRDTGKAAASSSRLQTKQPHHLTPSTEDPRPPEGQSVNTGQIPNPKVAVTGEELPPLLFQFTGDHIVAGMTIDGHLHLLRNEYGKEMTPAIVTWSQGRFRLERSGVPQAQPMASNSWRLSECLLGGNDTQPWSEAVPESPCQITFEFLFAFILRKFKVRYETEQRGKCSRAVVAVPFWLCSNQKLQIKDGAKAAGFTEVYLVNETSAAVYAYAMKEEHAFSSSNILVLAVKEERVQASVFTHSSGKDKTVTMLTNCTDEEYINEVMRFSARYCIGQKKLAEKLCKTVLKSLKKSVVPTNQDPIAGLVICDNQRKRSNLEDSVLQGITRLEKYNPRLVLEGIALLGTDPTQIGKRLQNCLEYDVYRTCEYEISDVTIIPKGEILPQNFKLKNVNFPRRKTQGWYYQIVEGEEYLIGKLQLRSRTGENTAVPVLEINSEGIVQLREVKLRKQNNQEKRLVSEEDYVWETLNLSIEALEDIKQVVSQCIPEAVKMNRTFKPTGSAQAYAGPSNPKPYPSTSSRVSNASSPQIYPLKLKIK